MASNVVTIPNLLTFLRMALIPVFASLLFYGYSGWALFVFLIAGISDGVDGFIARRFNQESELGTIIDPIADKLLMTTAFIILTMPKIRLPHAHALRILRLIYENNTISRSDLVQKTGYSGFLIM